jgi:hypothetical protein
MHRRNQGRLNQKATRSFLIQMALEEMKISAPSVGSILYSTILGCVPLKFEK